ncbi:MAG: XisI protein [Candidatus Electrothrix sp. AUS1_2]|nr:XisI protein [Candidatus Electrothrix sp. AUS1_2]
MKNNDSIGQWRKIIQDVILKYAGLLPSHGDIRLDPIFDETNDRYVLMQTGWDQGHRVRGNLIYISLQDGKVHIEYDGMEQGVTDDLVRNGIPENQIILSYMPELKTA